MKKVNLKSSVLLLKNVNQRLTVETFYNKNFRETPVLILNVLNFSNFNSLKRLFLEKGLLNNDIKVVYISNFKVLNKKNISYLDLKYFNYKIIPLFSGCLVSIHFSNYDSYYKFLDYFLVMEPTFKNYYFSDFYLSIPQKESVRFYVLNKRTIKVLKDFKFQAGNIINSVIYLLLKNIQQLMQILLKNLVLIYFKSILKLINSK